MLRRLERLVAIHDALRRSSPHQISAQRLADDFGVTRRTIERDIAALRDAGVPLYAHRGRNGGHVSLDQMGSTVVSLTTSEVTALLIAVAGAGGQMPYADAAETAVERLLDAMPATTRVAVEELRDKVRTGVARSNRPPNLRVRRTIETAVQRGLVVNISYRDHAGTDTSRSVDAVGLFSGTDGWHLIGWCHLRKDRRLFRLDRIRTANLTQRPIEPRDVDATLGWVPIEVSAPKGGTRI